MFKRTVNWFKKHPMTALAIAGVTILVILLFSRGSSTSSGSTIVQGGPSDAQVQANAALQAAQISAGVQNYTTAAQLQASQNQTAAQVAVAQLQAQSQLATTQAQENVSLAGIAAQQSVQVSGLQSQVQLADIAASVNKQQIQSNVAIAQAQSQTYQSITNAQAEVQMASIKAAAAVQLAPYQAASNLYSTLGSSGLTAIIKQATTVKDAVVNLPGISAMRATNWAPSGATPIPGTNWGGIIGGGLSAIAGLI